MKLLMPPARRARPPGFLGQAHFFEIILDNVMKEVPGSIHVVKVMIKI